MYESTDLSQREIDELLATATEAAMSALQKTWECETQLFWAAVDGDDLFTWLGEDHPQLAACIWRLGLQKEFNKRIKAAVALMEDAELMVYRMDDASITHIACASPDAQKSLLYALIEKEFRYSDDHCVYFENEDEDEDDDSYT